MNTEEMLAGVIGGILLAALGWLKSRKKKPVDKSSYPPPACLRCKLFKEAAKAVRFPRKKLKRNLVILRKVGKWKKIRKYRRRYNRL